MDVQAIRGLKIQSIFKKDIRQSLRWDFHAFFILVGSNDLFAQEIDSAEFYCYVRSLIALIRFHSPDALIVFASILPRLIYIKRLSEFVIHNKIKHFNRAMNYACEDTSVKYLNLYKRMLEQGPHDSDQVIADMLQPDGIHLGPVGKKVSGRGASV